MDLLLKCDFPAFEAHHSCPADTSIAALRKAIQQKGGAQVNEYSVAAACLGQDVIVIEAEDEEQSLQDLGVRNHSTVIFFAPASVKPQRMSKLKEEEENKESSEGIKSGGKYAKFNLKNVFKFLKDGKANDRKLASNFLEANAAKIFTDGKEFLKLSPKFFCLVLAKDGLNIPEVDLYKAAVRWCAKHKAPKSVQADVFSNIRFPCMTTVDISAVSSSGHLESNDLLALFVHCALPLKSRPKAVKGFTKAQCTPRKPRDAPTREILAPLDISGSSCSGNANGWGYEVKFDHKGIKVAYVDVRCQNQPAQPNHATVRWNSLVKNGSPFNSIGDNWYRSKFDPPVQPDNLCAIMACSSSGIYYNSGQSGSHRPIGKGIQVKGCNGSSATGWTSNANSPHLRFGFVNAELD